MMTIGGILLVVGLVGTLISWIYNFVQPPPGWLSTYDGWVNRGEGNYNLFLFIAAPILLIMGGFYFGEQVVLRRRFERMLDTPKKSEFASRRRDLEDLSKRLPEAYAKRISEKESEFVSKRNA